MPKPHDATSPRAPQQADKVMVRFHDDGLRKQLKVRAAQNERTLNAEINYLIKLGLSAEARGAKA